ncbi:hypothetical protein PCASD_23432 [Puccinia coronata f. sp. avenae]|uniref:Uncharacterized protein n=1 Tax=Puccinia coronata f. sp. avenae TaxID=200324 RepID=A0A2N5RXW3_9BASI|nr:hypothetical protein PCASD_23432 [Puccinia coronata f. sp. avenae]
MRKAEKRILPSQSSLVASVTTGVPLGAVEFPSVWSSVESTVGPLVSSICLDPLLGLFRNLGHPEPHPHTLAGTRQQEAGTRQQEAGTRLRIAGTQDGFAGARSSKDPTVQVPPWALPTLWAKPLKQHHISWSQN